MNKPLHKIVIGRFSPVIHEMRPKMISFDPIGMYGETDEGPFKIVSVDRPESLHGLSVRSYEFHDSAYWRGASAHNKDLCKDTLEHLMERNKAK